MSNNYIGEEFLDKLYRDLYMSDEVQHTKENKDKRLEAIKKYMDRLERVHSKADTDGKKNLLYSLYFNKYVIKRENIHAIDESGIERIQNAQKKSLTMWLEYLSNPTAVYPTWAKYWAFQGMLKMGSYDDFKGVYLKRDKKTKNPFVECNPEIIAKCISTIMKLVNKEVLDEDIKEKLGKTDSFSRIYTIFEKQYKKNVVNRLSSEGIWIKYNQGNREDAIRLSKSLEGKNTGWCTASEDIAISQVCGPYNNAENGGDFYVYYTKDIDGNYTVPRIAIRLDGHNYIGEIRGVEEGQNLEESMIGVLENKLNDMTFLSSKDVKKNLRIIEDLKELSIIGKKTENKTPLTNQEIENLYTKQYGFGWEQDPKVEKIINKRNILEDYYASNDDIKVMFLTMRRLPKNVKIKEEDEDVLIRAVKEDGYALQYVDKEIQKAHPEIVMDAVKENGYALQYVDEEIQKEYPEMVDEAIIKCSGVLLYLSNDILKEHMEAIMKAVKEDGYFLRDYRDSHRYKQIDAAVSFILEYIDIEFLKEYPEIVLEAVKVTGYALEYVDKEIQKAHPEIVMAAVKENGCALQYVDKEIQTEIVMAAVKEDGYTLQYVDKEIQKAHPEIVMEAVKEDGYALQYVDKEIQKAHPEIVIEAVKKNGYALKYVDKEIQKAYPEIVMAAVKEYGFTLQYVDKEIQKAHPEIVMAAVKESGSALQYVDKEIKQANPEISLEAVRNNALALQYVDKEIQKAHPEIAMEAVKSYGYALEYVDKEIQKAHPEIVIEAVKKNGYALKYVDKEIQKAYPEIVMAAVKSNGFILEIVDKEIKQANPEISLEAVRNNALALKYVDIEIRKAYPEIAMEAVKNKASALNFVPRELRLAHPEIVLEAKKTTERRKNKKKLTLQSNEDDKKTL